MKLSSVFLSLILASSLTSIGFSATKTVSGSPSAALENDGELYQNVLSLRKSNDNVLRFWNVNQYEAFEDTSIDTSLLQKNADYFVTMKIESTSSFPDPINGGSYPVKLGKILSIELVEKTILSFESYDEATETFVAKDWQGKTFPIQLPKYKELCHRFIKAGPTLFIVSFSHSDKDNSVSTIHSVDDYKFIDCSSSVLPFHLSFEKDSVNKISGDLVLPALGYSTATTPTCSIDGNNYSCTFMGLDGATYGVTKFTANDGDSSVSINLEIFERDTDLNNPKIYSTVPFDCQVNSPRSILAL